MGFLRLLLTKKTAALKTAKRIGWLTTPLGMLLNESPSNTSENPIAGQTRPAGIRTGAWMKGMVNTHGPMMRPMQVAGKTTAFQPAKRLCPMMEAARATLIAMTQTGTKITSALSIHFIPNANDLSDHLFKASEARL